MATVEEIQKEAAELNEKFQKSQEGRENVFVWEIAMTTLESSIQQLNVTISENTTVKKVGVFVASFRK